MLWFKSKKAEPRPLRKSHSCTNSFYQSLYHALYLNNHYDLAAFQAVSYYMKAAPLYTAVDLISKEVASIVPVVRNVKTGEISTEHPILDLLRSPNSDESYKEFITAFASFLLITGENYAISTGLASSEPKEVMVVPPQSINIMVVPNDGITSITYQTNGDAINFKPDKSLQSAMASNRTRYYTITDTQELWQTISFNPTINKYKVHGMSPFTPLFYQIEQYINADIHNLSLLKRGGRLSGAFTVENELTTEQFDRLRQQINELYSGSENAGRIGLFDGDRMEYQELGMNLKDMDFVALKDNVETAIYNALHIPLPFVKSETMTLANMETAKLTLYDNAVLPLTKRIFEELTLMLMYRYKNSEDLELSFIPQSIPALESRRIAQLKEQSEINVMGINEMRNILGLVDADDGSDIYRPATAIPVAKVPPKAPSSKKEK